MVLYLVHQRSLLLAVQPHPNPGLLLQKELEELAAILASDLPAVADLYDWDSFGAVGVLVGLLKVASVEDIHDLKVGFDISQITHAEKRARVSVEIVAKNGYLGRQLFFSWWRQLFTFRAASCVAHRSK